MTRPLMQHGVGQLEELFSKSKADTKVLKQLEHELQYRQVPRAIALLAEVQAAMYGGAAASPPATSPTPARTPPTDSNSKQPDLWGCPPTAPVAAPAAAPIATDRTVTCTAKPPEPAPATKPADPAPVMPLEDAYRVLKATPGATWESLEQTRRTLVLESHPSRLKFLGAGRRAHALAEATRVNAAYAALSRARCGGR